MPRLFDEFGKFTSDGMECLREVSQVINPIFSKYKDKGFEVREIGHVVSFAVHDSENLLCLRDMHKQMKERIERDKK